MRIAVSGIGIISAIGRGGNQTLHSLRTCRSGVKPWGDALVGRVPLDDCELLSLLNLPRNAAISRTALLGMMAAGDALADAGLQADHRTGLVNATSTGGMDRTERFFAGDESLHNVVGHECADSTRRIGERIGAGGFTTTVSTACSSAANAIMLGAGLLRMGLADAVVAGGADALCRFTIGGFRSLGILDDSPCRPFDASRAGLNLGEGAGYVVLQREENLNRQPYGFLTGWANANDAFHQTASSVEGVGAGMAMEGALRLAGLRADQIDYVNAHGTGTPNNDASETAALMRVFGGKVPPFSSTKPLTGHTLAAAGGIEAVISLLTVKHGFLPPGMGFAAADDGCPAPLTALREGVSVGHVLSNSFGFGGNNATLIFSKE